MRVILKRDFFGPGAIIYPKSPAWGYTEVPAGVVLPRDAKVLPDKAPEPAAPDEAVGFTPELLDNDSAGHKEAEAVVAKADAEVKAKAAAFRKEFTATKKR